MAIGQRLMNHQLLSRSIGHGESTTGTILINRGSPNKSQNSITIGYSIRHPLKHNRPTPFTTNITIGFAIKSFAASIISQHLCIAKSDTDFWNNETIDSNDQPHIALFKPQTLTGQMGGDQRGRTGCIHR